MDTSSPEAEADSKAHVASLTAAWRQRSANAAAAATANGAAAASGPLVPVGEVKPAGPLTQFRLLLRRSWRQVTLGARICSDNGTTAFAAVLLALVPSRSQFSTSGGCLANGLSFNGSRLAHCLSDASACGRATASACRPHASAIASSRQMAQSRQTPDSSAQ